MPLYEFYCEKCQSITEAVRLIAKRDGAQKCQFCKGPTERVVSAPTVQIWDDGRRFPNLTQHGDGTMAFPNKACYEAYLKEQDIAEYSTDAPVKRPHGNRLIGTWK